MRPMKAIGGVMMALGFVFALAGVAAAQDVKVDYDHTVDFSKYKTFWIASRRRGPLRSRRSEPSRKSRRL